MPTQAPTGLLTTSLQLAAVPSAVAAARSFATDSLRLWQLPPETADDATLIVSELVTNAVRCGGIAELEPDNPTLAAAPLVRLQLTRWNDSLLIEVWDAAEGVPELRQQYEDTEGGRGLYLVAMLAERWSYYVPPLGGKVVWAELAIGKIEQPQPATAQPSAPLPKRERKTPEPGALARYRATADVALLERVLWGLQALNALNSKT